MTPCTVHKHPEKKKDFQLVRLYHPDKVGTSSDIAHTRFQAITAAYDILKGKKTSGNASGAAGSTDVPYRTTASWRAMRKRRQELYDSGPVDDGRNDRLIIVGVVAVKKSTFVSYFNSQRAYNFALSDDSDCPLPNCIIPTGGTWGHNFKDSTNFYRSRAISATGLNGPEIISQQETGSGRYTSRLNSLCLSHLHRPKILFFVK